MKTILLATGNRGKVQEIRQMLEDTEVRVVTMKEMGLDPDIEENGETFRENALIKARTVAAALRASGLPAGETVVLADDSGLEVDAMGGGPGVYSARFMGYDTDYAVKMAAILEKERGLIGAERHADFRCVMAAVFPDGREITEDGVFDGLVAVMPAGTGGFGYDPLLYLPEYGCTSAELTPEQKNAISHRGKAIRAMLPHLLSWLAEDKA